MKLKPVFQLAKSGQASETFSDHIARNANDHQNGTNYTQTMPQHSTWLKPIMIVMVKSFFKNSIVIGEANVDKCYQRKRYNN